MNPNNTIIPPYCRVVTRQITQVNLRLANKAVLTKLPQIGSVHAGKIITENQKKQLVSPRDLVARKVLGNDPKGKKNQAILFFGYCDPDSMEMTRNIQKEYIAYNINTAPLSALMEIIAVGRTTAEKIITERKRRPFASVKDAINRLPQNYINVGDVKISVIQIFCFV